MPPRRRTPSQVLFAILATALVATAGAAYARAGTEQAATTQAGRLEGNVLLSSRIAQRRSRFRLYTEYGQNAAPPGPAGSTNELGNVVIYLDSAIADAEVPAGSWRVRQVNEGFAPHVLAVPAGATVEFPNEDPFFHNVFSLSKTRTFDLGRFAQRTVKSIQFDRPGIVQIFCHIHSDMSAVVLVAPSRFYATPDSTGAYSIDGIPPGRYRVVAWHERAKPTASTVEINPARPARLDFNIPISDAAPAVR